jgi:predicted nucleic acid-binding protein
VAARITPVAGSSRAFLDTNILVYADDAKVPAKQSKALELIEEHLRLRTGVISIQVLQEYFTAVVRKLNLDVVLAKRKVAIYARLHVLEPRVGSVLSAIDLHRLHGVSFWDALILQSAKEAGCGVLLTEDMQHGQVVDGVRIVDPFV